MRFPDSFLDDIRDRLPISEVIGQRVAFDKKKTNVARRDFWGCCPFHGEKTPSFHCEDQKGRYYCFGCGVSGDHFRFLTELDGISFAEAVERLAAQAGLPMPVLDKREQEREEKRKTLFDVMEMASKFFQSKLHEPVGAEARAYLRNRGLSPAIQQEFGIGFAPDSRNALKQFLAEQGVDAAQMEACGLVNFGEGIAVSYDKFRGRIMFPILDSRDRTIAFGGRAMDPNVPAKYLNSPETELFKKSNVLYNLARARRSKNRGASMVVVEGYMDVIALHAAGFENVVAPLGTALTESHIDTLWKVTDQPILCFDGDAAGLRAANRTTDLALEKLTTGKALKFCLLPNELDPDDFLKERGAAEFSKLLSNSAPISEYLVSRHLDYAVWNTPEQKAKLERTIFDDVAKVRDPLLRKYLNSHVRFRLVEAFGLSTGFANNLTKNKPNSLRNNHAVQIGVRENRRHRIILGLCVEFPYLFADFIEELSKVHFRKDKHKQFVDELYKLYVEDIDLKPSDIYSKISPVFYDVLFDVHGFQVSNIEEYKENNLQGGGPVPWALDRGHRLLELFPVLKFEPSIGIVKETMELHLLEEIYDQMRGFLMTVDFDNRPDEGLVALEEFQSLKMSYEEKVRRVDNLYQTIAGRDHYVDDNFVFDHTHV